MLNAVLPLLVIASVGAVHDELSDKIVAAGHQRIVICPRVVSTDIEGEAASFAGRLGPQAGLVPNQLAERLRETSRKRYELVSFDVVNRAMQGMTVEDLQRASTLQMLGKRTGADALVMIKAKSTGRSKRIYTAELFDLVGGGKEAQVEETIDEGLSDAAFSGRSFEARRWVDGRVKAVGLNSRLGETRAFGLGAEYERLQLAAIVADGPHPLERPQFDYGFAIVVDGKVRPWTRIGSELYVALEPGEKFGIHVWNDSDHDAFCGLFIDGVNTINKVFEHPLVTPTSRHWYLERRSGKRMIRGWFAIDSNRQLQSLSRFQVVLREESVAFGQGVAHQFSTITAIVYTKGLDIGASVPRTPLKSKGGLGSFAIGEAESENVSLRFRSGQRGIMLAAMTVHYRTSSELQKLRERLLARTTSAKTTQLDKPANNQTKPSETVPMPRSDGKATASTAILKKSQLKKPVRKRPSEAVPFKIKKKTSGTD